MMDQESAFFTALADAKKYDLDGETTGLSNSEGQKLVTFTRTRPRR